MAMATNDSKILDLPGFIRACVERAGGVVDSGAPGRLDVLLPPALEGIAAGRSWMSLALTLDGVGTEAEPATLGSPFMDALIAFAAGRGTIASGYLPAGRLKRKGLREEVERTLRFSNCRTRYQDAEAEVCLSASVQFDFKVVFLCEERRERVYVVPVNLFSGQVDLELAARLPGLPIEDSAEGRWPEAQMISVESAHQTASEALRRLVREEAARQQVRVGRRFAVEFARIRDYYADAIAGLERRRDREQRRTVALAKMDVFAQKLEAAGGERERKLRELGETYGIRTRARLASARCLWQPKVFFKLLLDRGSATRSLTLAYDGLRERVELPDCDACRQPTASLRASSTAQLLCPSCSADEGPARRM